jgi:hypothetical protein
MRRVKHVVTRDGQHYGYRFDCPGCGEPHVIPTKPHERGWDFNGNEERPTFGPSILVYEVKAADGSVFSPRCHSFVRDGRIEYCGDSTHALAGQTVDLPEIDDLQRGAGKGGEG